MKFSLNRVDKELPCEPEPLLVLKPIRDSEFQKLKHTRDRNEMNTQTKIEHFHLSLIVRLPELALLHTRVTRRTRAGTGGAKLPRRFKGFHSIIGRETLWLNVASLLFMSFVIQSDSVRESLIKRTPY